MTSTQKSRAKQTKCRRILSRVSGAYFCLLLSAAASAATAQHPETNPEPSATRAEAAATRAAQPTLQPYRVNRQDEDWRTMRDPARRADWSDELKYIPLRNRENWFVSIGGEWRPFYERYRNENWGAEPPDPNGYLLNRFLLHADFHFGGRVRFFGQLQSGITASRRGAARPSEKDTLDVLQAFADVKWNFKSERSLTLRAGRQELSYGSGRLVSIREGANVRQTFDGAKLRLNAGKWRVDGFVVKPVENAPGVFDDAPVSSQTFWGVYAARPKPRLLPVGNLDLYYLGLARRNARFDQGSAEETRHTTGARLADERGAWDYDAELIYQFGKFGKKDISAWAIGIDGGYTLRDATLAPRFGFKANATSGDRDPNDSRLNTFHPLFPRGAYFGRLSSIGPLNHRDLHPTLDLNLPRRVFLTASWVFYWRQSLRDGVYSVPGNLLRTGRLSNARFVGHQPGVEINWQADRHTTFGFYVAGFVAKRFLRETPPGENTTFVAAWMTYRF